MAKPLNICAAAILAVVLTACAVVPPPGTGQSVQRALIAECANELGVPLGTARVRVDGAVVQGTTLTVLSGNGIGPAEAARINECKDRKAASITRGPVPE